MVVECSEGWYANTFVGIMHVLVLPCLFDGTSDPGLHRQPCDHDREAIGRVQYGGLI